MRVTFKMTKLMAMGHTNTKMGQYIQVIGQKTCRMGLVKKHGLIKQGTKASSSKGKSMARVN